MATTTATPSAASIKETLIDTILHDVITAGILAASIFVKNANSRNRASQIIGAVNQLLPLVDAGLGQTPAPPAA